MQATRATVRPPPPCPRRTTTSATSTHAVRPRRSERASIMPASWTRRTATFALVTLVAAVHATHARHGRSLRLDRHPAAAPASSTPSHRSDAPAAAAGAFAASNGVRRLFQSLAEAAPSPEGGALEPRGDLNLSTTALGTDGLRGVLDYLRVTLLASGDAADRAISEQVGSAGRSLQRLSQALSSRPRFCN